MPDRPPYQRRLGLALTALVAGLIGLAASLGGLNVGVMPRHFTAAQQREIISWEIGKRWRTWPAGEIFPATVTYRLSGASLASDTGLTLTARRVGIAPQAPCAAGGDSAATDPAAAQALANRHCAAVLRATYLDATRAFVTTVGVAVLPSAAAASAAHTALSAPPPPGALRPGIRVLVFPGTLTGLFGNQARQISASTPASSYLVMYAAGYADGRPRATSAGDQYGQGELLSVAGGIAANIAGRLAAPPAPPRCPGAPGC